MPIKPEHQQALDGYLNTDHKGNRLSPDHKKAMLKANPMIAKVLMARAVSLSDDERASLKGMVTPENTPALKKLLPELAQILDKGVNNGG